MTSNQREELNLFNTLNSRSIKLSECEKELVGWERELTHTLNPND